jgi:hypothetical protein
VVTRKPASQNGAGRFRKSRVVVDDKDVLRSHCSQPPLVEGSVVPDDTGVKIRAFLAVFVPLGGQNRHPWV